MSAFARTIGKGRCGVLFLLCLSVSLGCGAEPDKAKLREWLATGRYAELDAELSAYQAAYREGRTGDEDAFKGITALTVIDSELQPAYNRWVEQYPRSYVARLARGFYFSGLGWSARGSAYASETARFRFHDMRAYFRSAMEDLETSLTLDAKPVLSYATMIRVARADSSFGDIGVYLAHAIALDQRVYNARMSYLLGIRPEWGGSLEAMERFVADSRPHISAEQAVRLQRVLENSKARAELASGEHLAVREQFEEALNIYNAVLAKRPSPRGYAARGYAYARLKRHDRALEDFDRALALDPDDECCGNTYSNRAHSYLAIGERAKALADFVQAAEEHNDHWAAQQLAGMYAYGWHGTNVDPVRAWPWCERAAKQGDPWSMYCIGHIYRTGWGRKPDAAKGLHWLERAAERGIAGAQYDLGWVYWTGEGTPWNGFKALQWWMRAAVQGDALAQRRVFTVALGPALIVLLLGVWGALRHSRKR